MSLRHSVGRDESFEGNVAAVVPHVVAEGTALRQGHPAGEPVAPITRLLDLELVVRDVATSRSRWLPAQLNATVGFYNSDWSHNSRDRGTVESVYTGPRACSTALHSSNSETAGPARVTENHLDTGTKEVVASSSVVVLPAAECVGLLELVAVGIGGVPAEGYPGGELVV